MQLTVDTMTPAMTEALIALAQPHWDTEVEQLCFTPTPAIYELVYAAHDATIAADEASDDYEFRDGSKAEFHRLHQIEQTAHQALVTAVLAASGDHADAWSLLYANGSMLVS